MKKGLVVFLLFVLILLPAASAGADAEMGGGFKRSSGPGEPWVCFEARITSIEKNFRASLKDENAETPLAVKIGLTWYDQEELLFTEMAQAHDTECVVYRWQSPDVFWVITDTVAGYRGNRFMGVETKYIRMTHGYEGRERQ